MCECVLRAWRELRRGKLQQFRGQILMTDVSCFPCENILVELEIIFPHKAYLAAKSSSPVLHNEVLKWGGGHHHL